MRLFIFSAILLSSAAVIFSSCRLRSKSTAEASYPPKVKSDYALVATCATDSSGAEFKTLLIQEDKSTMRALLLMNYGGNDADSLKIFGATVTIESRSDSEIRKLYQAEQLSLTLELERKGTDTFDAKIIYPEGKSDVAYSCAM